MMLLETLNEGIFGSFHFWNLCPSVNLSPGFGFYVIKMFPVKVMRPAITNEINPHSGSLPGIFKMVEKVIKMAILATLRIGM